MDIKQQGNKLSAKSDKLLTLNWYRTLSSSAVHAFWASFMGWALDAFDYQIFTFILTAVAAAFSRRITEATIETIPDGSYEFVDYLGSDTALGIN